MKNRTLVIVDFQNDFVHPDGALTVNNPELIAKMNNFALKLESNMFERILLTADNHNKETYHLTEEAKLYPPHCLKDTWGWEYAVKFKENIPIKVLYKEGNDIWGEVSKYEELQEDWNGREVYIAGLVSDVCVQKAMDGFLKRGAKVAVFEDLTKGLERDIENVIAGKEYADYINKGNLRCITSLIFENERQEK